MLKDPSLKTPVTLPAPTLQQTEGISLLSLIATAWRHKVLMFVCATTFVMIGGYYAFAVATPKFSTGTTLALQLRSEQLINIDQVISGVSSEEEAINTELQVIQSRGLLEKLVAELDLTNDPEFNVTLRPQKTFSLGKLKAMVALSLSNLLSGSGSDDTLRPDQISSQRRIMIDTVDELRAAIDTEHLRDTYIFRILVTTRRPMKSARIANTLADVYIRDQLEQKFDATESAITWLAERVSELSAELEEKQNRAEAMRTEMELTSGEALEVANQRARSIRTRLDDALADMNRLTAQRDALAAARATTDPTALAAAINDPILDRLLPRLIAGNANSQKAFDDRIEVVRANLNNDVTRAGQQVSALRPSLELAEQEIVNQSEELLQLQQLERDLTSTQTLYETFLTRLKEASVQRGVQQADSRVLSEATPGDLVAPRRTRIVLLSGILGLMFGAGLLALRQFTNTGLRTSEELEALSGSPVMGRIPNMPISKRSELLPYLRDKPTSASAEAIRNLRTSLLLHNIDNPPQIIMSTSALPGEGKTTQSIALAQNLANLNKRVLLIEGDMRRLTFDKYFDVKPCGSGLLSIMTGEASLEETVQFHEPSGLSLLIGNKTKANPADIFASERFLNLLEEIRAEYDYVVIDTPPILAVPDALVIGQHVDSILLSVAWDATPRSQVAQALRQMQTVNLHPTGVVMSMIDPKKSMMRYGYYNTYGSSYYSD